MKLRNDFLEIFEKNSSKKWFPTQLNSRTKIFRTAVIQESCFKFYMKCLNCLTFVTAHAFLTGWYLFHIFHSCTILVYSIGHTGFLLHLAHFQHCNLGEFGWRTQVQTRSRGFYFPCCSILQRNFPNFGIEILALHSAKSFWGLYFS